MSFTDPANLGYSKNFTRNFECFSLPFTRYYLFYIAIVLLYLALLCVS